MLETQTGGAPGEKAQPETAPLIMQTYSEIANRYFDITIPVVEDLSPHIVSFLGTADQPIDLSPVNFLPLPRRASVLFHAWFTRTELEETLAHFVPAIATEPEGAQAFVIGDHGYSVEWGNRSWREIEVRRFVADRNRNVLRQSFNVDREEFTSSTSVSSDTISIDDSSDTSLESANSGLALWLGRLIIDELNREVTRQAREKAEGVMTDPIADPATIEGMQQARTSFEQSGDASTAQPTPPTTE